MLRILFALVLCSCARLAGAGDFDGSRQLICAPVEARECGAAARCESTLPSELGAPAFVRIDFAQGHLVGPQGPTPIRLMEKNQKQILMMGTERGFGWTIVLDEETGEISATVADRHGAVVLFGSCTPL